MNRKTVATLSAVAALLLVLACSSNSQSTATAQSPNVDQAVSTAVDAYVYGYSLLTTDVTRIQNSNIPAAELAKLKAPLGQFANAQRYPPGDYRGVSAPNADTLYSMAWVDLAEPQVFSHPDMGKRYYLFEMTDLWMTDFNDPSVRTAGGKAANYLLTGPGWEGTVPAGMTQIKCATRYMVILGRTYADGTDKDYAIVNALQAQYKITPLSAWGKPYTYQARVVEGNVPYSMTDSPQKAILALGTAGYFNRMAQLMCKAAPAASEDAPMLSKLATLGIEPCKPFDMSKLDSATQAALNNVPQLALKRIEANKANLGKMVNGWVITAGLGVYGTDYVKRAVVAAFGWPANLEHDAVYPFTEVDSTGKPFSGANSYTITFAKGQTPPVNGFWSITMYEIESDGWWFVPNPLNKFTVSPRNKLKYNPDGSLTLYLQARSPGQDKEANWLPAPTGAFLPMLRMYWPKDTPPSVLDGSWTPPPVAMVQ